MAKEMLCSFSPEPVVSLCIAFLNGGRSPFHLNISSFDMLLET